MNCLNLHSLGLCCTQKDEMEQKTMWCRFSDLFQITRKKIKYHTICIYCSSSSSDALPILRMHIFTYALLAYSILLYAVWFQFFPVKKHRRNHHIYPLWRTKAIKLMIKIARFSGFSVFHLLHSYLVVDIFVLYFFSLIFFSTHLTTIDELMLKNLFTK